MSGFVKLSQEVDRLMLWEFVPDLKCIVTKYSLTMFFVVNLMNDISMWFTFTRLTWLEMLEINRTASSWYDDNDDDTNNNQYKDQLICNSSAGMSTTSLTCATICSGSVWMVARSLPARSPVPSTRSRAATIRTISTSLLVSLLTISCVRKPAWESLTHRHQTRQQFMSWYLDESGRMDVLREKSLRNTQRQWQEGVLVMALQ